MVDQMDGTYRERTPNSLKVAEANAPPKQRGLPMWHKLIVELLDAEGRLVKRSAALHVLSKDRAKKNKP